MIVKITKIFTIGAFEKEEKWLNEMAAKGLNLIHTNGITYTFQEGIPGEYTYRLELLAKLPTHLESVKYLQFLEETGVEPVISHVRWVYLRKKKSDGEFILYSDLKSKLHHYHRIGRFGMIISLIPAIQIITNFINLFLSNRDYIDHTVHIFLIILMILLLALIQFQMIPVYKVILKLKRDIKIHE